MVTTTPLVRRLGCCDYLTILHDMQAFTSTRTVHTPDELWLLEHFPVYTLGLNGQAEHVLDRGGVPLVRCDRGGQVTYHGPGQWVLYCLIDLRRRGWSVKRLVYALEQAVIDLIADHGYQATRRQNAPGVYLHEHKIAALGLRVRNGASYHGLSLNVAMDLEPYTRIHPCGYAGMRVTQLADLGITDAMDSVGTHLLRHMVAQLTEERMALT